MCKKEVRKGSLADKAFTFLKLLSLKHFDCLKSLEKYLMKMDRSERHLSRFRHFPEPKSKWKRCHD